MLIKTNKKNSVQAKLLDSYISDHKSIVVNIQSSRSGNANNKSEIRNQNKRNIQRFKDHLHSLNWADIITPHETLDNNIYNFINTILSIYDKCIPLIIRTSKQNDSDWINSKIRYIIKHKNFLLRKARRTKTDSDIKK